MIPLYELIPKRDKLIELSLISINNSYCLYRVDKVENESIFEWLDSKEIIEKTRNMILIDEFQKNIFEYLHLLHLYNREDSIKLRKYVVNKYKLDITY